MQTLDHGALTGQEQTMVMVENICAVEPLDYGALGKSNMGQIIHKTPDDGTGIIYFQAKVRVCFTTLCYATLHHTTLHHTKLWYTTLH